MHLRTRVGRRNSKISLWFIGLPRDIDQFKYHSNALAILCTASLSCQGACETLPFPSSLTEPTRHVPALAKAHPQPLPPAKHLPGYLPATTSASQRKTLTPISRCRRLFEPPRHTCTPDNQVLNRDDRFSLLPINYHPPRNEASRRWNFASVARASLSLTTQLSSFHMGS